MGKQTEVAEKGKVRRSNLGRNAEGRGRVSEAPPITLYTFTMSPYAQKVHCYLQFKRLPFQCFYINPLRLKKDLPAGTQVPALTVGLDSRVDSTVIGHWLDEIFPDHARLLPENPEQRAKILEIDHWVTHRLIPGNFRQYPGVGLTPRRLLNGWRLGQILHKTSHGGIPLTLQALWPLVLSQLGFLKEMVAMTDQHLPLKKANKKLCEELLGHLGAGPFLGGMSTPSMADLSAFPQLVTPYMAGFNGAEDIMEYPEIVRWLNNVRLHMRDMPPLLPSIVVKRAFPGDSEMSFVVGRAVECP